MVELTMLLFFGTCSCFFLWFVFFATL